MTAICRVSATAAGRSSRQASPEGWRFVRQWAPIAYSLIAAGDVYRRDIYKAGRVGSDPSGVPDQGGQCLGLVGVVHYSGWDGNRFQISWFQLEEPCTIRSRATHE